MAFCSAPGITKEHSDAQSRGGAFCKDWEPCAMLRMNCTMWLYSVGKCGWGYNGNHSRPQGGEPLWGRQRSYGWSPNRGYLQRHGNGKPDVRIAAVVEVVSIVVVDVNVICAIPVFRPVFRIWIDQQERVAAVEEARISHVHNGAASHAEEVFAAETEIEAGLRNVVTAVASALLPGAVVGRPVLGAILLPGTFRLPTAALLYPSPLLLPRTGLLLVALGLNLRLRLRGALLLWLGVLGALRLLGLLSLRLLGTLLWLSLRLLGALLLLLLLRLGALLLLGLLRTLLLLLLRGLLGPLLRLWRTLLLGLLSTLLLRLRRPLLLLLGLLGVLLLLRLRRTLLLRLLRALLLLGLLGMLLL